MEWIERSPGLIVRMEQLQLPTITRLCPSYGVDWVIPGLTVRVDQLHLPTITILCPPYRVDWVIPWTNGECWATAPTNNNQIMPYLQSGLGLLVRAEQLHLPTISSLCPPQGVEWAFPGIWFGKGNCTYQQWEIMPSQRSRVGVPWPMVCGGQLHLPTMPRLYALPRE
jgi:hypothetical protein